jgi:hypothetical protein
VERGTGERSTTTPFGESSVLEPGVHEPHRTEVLQVPRGERKQLRAGLDCDHIQADGEQIARQLPATAPDLEH